MHEADEGVTENFDWNVGGEKAKRTPPQKEPGVANWCQVLVAVQYLVPASYGTSTSTLPRTPNGRNEGSDLPSPDLALG
ncbi:uncharacterized protein TrAtP1_001612 [Trichoderma atroviride]|uniref:uncharacterized protein n=1 Tax=Hypocrea atroviridis TaxID=63577 RepID=UPI003332432A|nr:hypothetical protein TrAtP1_001612 [Trichoderma atroviride]